MGNKALEEKLIDYEALLNKPTDDNYVSLMAVIQVLDKKRKEVKEKSTEFNRYLNEKYKGKVTYVRDVTDRMSNYSFTFYYNAFGRRGSNEKPGKNPLLRFEFREGTIETRYAQYLKDPLAKHRLSQLLNDEVIKEHMKYYHQYMQSIGFEHSVHEMHMDYSFMNDIKTQLGLYAHLLMGENVLKLLIGDKKHDEGLYNVYLYPNYFLDWKPKYRNLLDPNRDELWYFRDFISNERKMEITDESLKGIINEPKMWQIYCGLKIDISKFGKDLQEEFKSYEKSGLLAMNELKTNEEEGFRKLQTDRVMKAYQLFKQIAELLNNAETDLDVEKLKIKGLEKIIFKNNGHPTQNGYIEFEDFFRDNTVLRMLDLHSISLKDVFIRGMDFSGTNIHFNPQEIYNRDMTDVNATGVTFSPFTDSFDDAILDGAIITDYQANIDLEKVKSYNEATVIPSSKSKH